jgi:hypothetical protein
MARWQLLVLVLASQIAVRSDRRVSTQHIYVAVCKKGVSLIYVNFYLYWKQPKSEGLKDLPIPAKPKTQSQWKRHICIKVYNQNSYLVMTFTRAT